MKFILLITLTYFSFNNAAVLRNGQELPTYGDICYRNSPDFNSCIKKTLQNLIPKFKDGLKELNLTGLDPVHVPELLMNYENGDIQGKMIIRESLTHGLSGIKVLDVRSSLNHPDRFNMEVDYYLPKVRTSGHYKMEGLIGEFPVQGKGSYQVNMTDVSGTWKIKGHRVLDEKKETYMKITDFGMRPTVGHMDINMSNLVNGNQELSAIALTFINQFWKVVYDAVLPFAEQNFEKVAKPVLNKVFLTVPYNQLFPLLPGTVENFETA